MSVFVALWMISNVLVAEELPSTLRMRLQSHYGEIRKLCVYVNDLQMTSQKNIPSLSAYLFREHVNLRNLVTPEEREEILRSFKGRLNPTQKLIHTVALSTMIDWDDERYIQTLLQILDETDCFLQVIAASSLVSIILNHSDRELIRQLVRQFENSETSIKYKSHIAMILTVVGVRTHDVEVKHEILSMLIHDLQSKENQVLASCIGGKPYNSTAVVVAIMSLHNYVILSSKLEGEKFEPQTWTLSEHETLRLWAENSGNRLKLLRYTIRDQFESDLPVSMVRISYYALLGKSDQDAALEVAKLADSNSPTRAYAERILASLNANP